MGSPRTHLSCTHNDFINTQSVDFFRWNAIGPGLMHPQLQRGTRLPSLPTVAVEILRLFNDEDASIRDLTQIILTDPALSARILQSANSPRFGVGNEVTDLNRAVARLGKNNVTPLALSFSLSQDSIADSASAEFYRRIWLKSFIRATAAETIAQPYGAHTSAECFTIGLLAGIGRLAQLKADAHLYAECERRSAEEETPRRQIEEELFGISAVCLSVDILNDIALPTRCVKAVSELLNENIADVTDEASRVAGVTKLASAVARYLCDKDPAVGLIQLNDLFLAHQPTAGASVDHLLGTIHERLEASASLFDIDAKQLPRPADLLESALEQLSRFTSLIASGQPDRVPDGLLEENGRLKRRVQDLLRETSFDGLTGIHNRAWFDTNVLEVQALSRLNEIQFGIALIDIDHFKDVNDQHGHQAGDHVLRSVAQTLNRVTRREETLARYGGEEFALILLDANAEGMTVAGERLRATIESEVIEYSGQQIPITVSIGIAHGHPTSDPGFSRLLFAKADEVLYAAKRDGRNLVNVDSSFENPADNGPKSRLIQQNSLTGRQSGINSMTPAALEPPHQTTEMETTVS